MAYTLTYTLNSDGNSYTLSGYSGDAPTGELVIPDSYGSIPVTSIGYDAFGGCSGLTSLTIPNSVTSIRESAFNGCSGLISVTLGNSVMNIGDNAFNGCTSLTSVTVPNSVTSIGIGAFGGCSSLESITIPFVGAQAGKTSSDTNQYPFGYIFGTSRYTGGIATTQYYYGGSTSSTTNTTYYIPSSLKSVTVTGGNILHGAFDDCSGLTSITIPDSVTSIGNNAFYNCSGLTGITIPNSVTSIGDWVFYGCTGLTSITIPDSVTSIGSSAFFGCSGLTSITIGNGVTIIGSSAFYGCTRLTSINVAGGNTKYHSNSNCLIETETKTLILGCKTSVIPSDGSVTIIGTYAFRSCTGLTSITIPDSVTSIGDWAFDDCSGLTSITIGNSVTSIGNNAFYNCSGLTGITIPNSVTSIGSNAFYGCSSLTKINLLPITPPTMQSNTLIATIQSIYVPSQSSETYKSATNWNTYADKITEFPILDLGSLLMYNNKVKAKIDADSNKNEDTYAKQNGSYSNLTAGKANIHTTELLPLDADLNNYYGADYWGKNYYASGNNSIVNRPIANDPNGFSLEILRGGAGGTIQRCTIYAAGGSATQPVVFTRWHLGTAWKVWQETAEPDGTYPNMTVGKATNLTEPFIIGSDTNTAHTWVTKFATITLKTAWVSSATRFEIVDTNYTNNTTQPVGVEISASPSTTALTVRAYALYGNPQILNAIYISHSALGTFPMTVDLYYSIENTAYTTIGIKPLWQSRRSTNSNVEFITTNTNVSALPTDRTNIRLTQLANYAVITRAGYDGDGNNIASTYAKKAEISNPNLLVNPDFAINQRGQKSYSGGAYGVDRWLISSGTTAEIQESGALKLKRTAAGNCCLQRIENWKKLVGKTVTLSVKFSQIISGSVKCNLYTGTTFTGTTVSTSGAVSTVTVTIPTNATKVECFIYTNSACEVVPEYAKLEIGSTATEFIPPLIEEELLKCQALRTDPVQLLRSNSGAFTGLAAGQPIEKIVFNPNVSIEKMTDYLSRLTYDEAIRYDQTAPEVQCVCKLVSIDWFDNSIAVYAIDFNAFSSMMGTSGYAIGVIDTSGDGFVVKQTVFATEYSEANLQLVTAMADKNYTVQYTQAGWNDTKDYVLDTSTNHMIVGVYDNKVSAFIGRDSRFFDVIEMLDDSTTAETPDLSGLVSDVQANGVSVVSNRVANITKASLGLGNVDNTADVNKVVHGATVLTNQDLNNYKTTALVGWYYAAGGNSVTNKPSGVNEFGLEVIRAANGVFVQRLIYGNKIYQRTYGVSSWNNWVEFANTDDIPTKLSQLTNDSNFATVSQVNAKYTKPSDGIPKSDLASSVQTSLGKADTAFQGSMELQGTTLYITLP